MTPSYFSQVYSDADLRDFMHDMACRLSPTPETAEDAESEAWLAIWQAPDGVSVKSLKDAIVTTVASAVYVSETKPSKCWRAWLRVLKEYQWDGCKMNGKAMYEAG